jgi:hypothetical protein
MPNLHVTLNDLAQSFASAVLDAILTRLSKWAQSVGMNSRRSPNRAGSPPRGLRRTAPPAQGTDRAALVGVAARETAGALGVGAASAVVAPTSFTSDAITHPWVTDARAAGGRNSDLRDDRTPRLARASACSSAARAREAADPAASRCW